MKQQTAMQIMYEELMDHEYPISDSIIVKCKHLIEMEKEQIMSAHSFGGSNMEGGYDNFNHYNTDNHYYNEQYPPIKTDSILESLIDKYKQRSELGIKKYNTTLDRTDLTLLDWINHAQDEAMDLSLYLEKIKTILN